jgi:hypothetical protein
MMINPYIGALLVLFECLALVYLFRLLTFYFLVKCVRNVLEVINNGEHPLASVTTSVRL